MNTVSENKFYPFRFYGTIALAVMLAAVSTFFAVGNTSVRNMAQIQTHGVELILAVSILLGLLVFWFLIYFFVVCGMLGQSPAVVLDNVRKHNNNDSIAIIVEYLTLSTGIILASVSLNQYYGTFATNFMLKNSMLWGYGILLSILKMWFYYGKDGLSGREFVRHIKEPGSDALARAVGNSFFVVAVIMALLGR